MNRNKIFKVIKKLFFAIILFGLIHNVNAQQDPQFTNYMFNQQTFNPAFVGSTDFMNATLFHRKQWIGFGEGAPVTQSFSFGTPIKKKNIGIGFHIINESLGLSKNLSFSTDYSYQIKFGQKTLNMGLSVGFKQFGIDRSNLKIRDQQDQVFDQIQSKILLDAGFGLLLKHRKYYIGLSTLHINNPSIKLNEYTGTIAQLVRNYYLTAGYTYEMSERSKITPSFLMKFAESNKFLYTSISEFSVKYDYLELFWAGASYRTTDAATIFSGINLDKINPDKFRERVKIGFGFDFSTSRLPKYNTGTYELFISYDYFSKPKRQMPKFK